MDMNPDSAQLPPEWPSDSWSDPIEERNKFRLRLQRFRLGFSLIGLALLIYSISLILFMVAIFTGQGPGLGFWLGIPRFELIESALITWGSLLGVCMVWGVWPDVHWQRRSGILLLMCLVDAVLWSLDHAGELGLYDGTVDHKWFREALGTAMGWSEFALIATLAADLAHHLGEPHAQDLARSLRSLVTTAAMVWFLYFSARTNWIPPIWPLRPRMMNGWSIILFLAYHVLLAIILLQSTGLCLIASRCCGTTLGELARTDASEDFMPSRSEEGWKDMMGKSGSEDEG